MTGTEVMNKIGAVKRDVSREGVFINMFLFEINEWEFTVINGARDYLHITSKYSTAENYIGIVIELDEITDIS